MSNTNTNTTPEINSIEVTIGTDRAQTSMTTFEKSPVDTRTLLFESLDRIIVEGQLSFQKIGTAFARIKSEKLWDDFATGWTNYCESRGCTSTHANRIIQAARADQLIRDSLQTRPDTEYPRNEWQIRPLASSLTEKEIVQAWLMALEIAVDKNPVQKDVRAAVKQILGEEDVEKPNKKAVILASIARLYDLIVKREQSVNRVSFDKVEEAFGCLKAVV